MVESSSCRVYIGLGSNLDDPSAQVRRAVDALKQIPGCRYISDSGLFLSRPMMAEGVEYPQQDDYLNAVVLLDTVLSPRALLQHLQKIEASQGRTRELHWGPRTIDLDILLYGQSQLDEDDLKIPHPGLCEREFVLIPMQRLCEALGEPDLEIPGRGKLLEVVRACPENGIKFVGEIA